MNYTSKDIEEKNEENSDQEYNIEDLERKTELEDNTDYRGIAGKASLNFSKEEHRSRQGQEDVDNENPPISRI